MEGFERNLSAFPHPAKNIRRGFIHALLPIPKRVKNATSMRKVSFARLSKPPNIQYSGLFSTRYMRKKLVVF
ncbi:MAG: hypothetical protein C0507_23185 [Cyanobacteria bacterium PR.3.49]|nr:hypothetical protein [Cyanobacteria bacterium PR.3.49]